MKRIHLLSVEARADAFLELIEALRADGRRVGWLDLGGTQVPAALTAASGAGVLRAVGVDDGVTVAVKPRKGGVVMKDLLREYFVGCSVVLVRGGEGSAPSLGSGGGLAVGSPRSDCESPGHGKPGSDPQEAETLRTLSPEGLVDSGRQVRVCPSRLTPEERRCHNAAARHRDFEDQSSR